MKRSLIAALVAAGMTMALPAWAQAPAAPATTEQAKPATLEEAQDLLNRAEARNKKVEEDLAKVKDDRSKEIVARAEVFEARSIDLEKKLDAATAFVACEKAQNKRNCMVDVAIDHKGTPAGDEAREAAKKEPPKATNADSSLPTLPPPGTRSGMPNLVNDFFSTPGKCTINHPRRAKPAVRRPHKAPNRAAANNWSCGGKK